MKVLILRDHRPGHYNQCEGVVRALQRLRPLDVVRLDLAGARRLRGRVGRSAMRALGGVNGALALRFFAGIRLDDIDPPELIVSAGGDTLAANAMLARHFSVPNIFIGSLREYDEADFSAVLTIYPSVAVRPRHVLMLKPPPFDPDDLGAARCFEASGDLQGATCSLLVGGPSGSHDWHEADWQALPVTVGALSKRFGIDWTIGNSRRTPDAVTESLRRFSRQHPKVTRFIDIDDAGGGSATQLYRADILVITEDSATMMMEGVGARRPVVALVPENRRPSRDDEAIEGLEEARRLVRLQLTDATPEAFGAAVLHIEPLAGNPLDTLAADLKDVLGL